MGTVTSATVEPDKISLSGIIIRALPDAQTVLDVHKAGGAWECSVGTAPIEDKDLELIDSGSVTVNGQQIDAPVYLLHNAEIREVSFVSAGADPNTQIEIRASLTNDKDFNMDYTDEKFREFVELIGVDFDALEDDAKEDVYKTWTYKKDVTDAETVEAACDGADEKKVEAEVTEEHVGEFKEEKKKRG